VTTVELFGEVASGFEPVADAFLSNFEGPVPEAGAACAVYVDGRPVVDIWAGIADTTGSPWDRDTIAPVASTTKGMVGVALNLLAQRGSIDLDAPVAAYWPEFAAAGKEDLPVRMLVNHQAGLPYWDEPVTYSEFLEGVVPVERLAAQRPVWEPGTAFGYHAITYGWLAGEVIRRVTGLSVGQFFAREVVEPLSLRAWIGLPDAEQGHVAESFALPEPAPGASAPTHPLMGALVEMGTLMADPSSHTRRAFDLSGSLPLAPPSEPDPEEERAFRRAELAGIGGLCDARSLARMYGACLTEVDGVRLLDDDTVRDATKPQNEEGPDLVVRWPTVWGTGFMLPSAATSMITPRSFGYPGTGGSAGFADPATRASFGYVCNRMGPTAFLDPRKPTILAALRRVLGVSNDA
jgi:CubicO group peptidase (beta-lactamase class C family)